MSDSPVKFLLVDDLEENLLALDGLLRRDGLELLKARSGTEALELLLRHDVALVLLDVQMPGMDGFAVAELMRGAERTRRIPIIFITAGLGDKQRSFRGFELGAVDFLFKPIDPHILRSKANVFFELAQQRNELQAALQENARLLKERTKSEALIREQAENLERIVAERTARLREAAADLEHFSYTITHDMRAPLRAMRSFGQILREENWSQLDEQGRDYLRRIIQASNRMDLLITDALDYSRIVRSEFHLAAVDPKPLLSEIIESYDHLQQPQAEITVRGDMPLVLANTASLTQCFSNLLDNAVKFVEPGKVPVVNVWAEERDGMVRFWFQDNGIGIPQAQHERIFGLFERLSDQYEGTGVGLALVKKVVQRMQGEVGFESEQGKGTRFWIDLRKAP